MDNRGKKTWHVPRLHISSSPKATSLKLNADRLGRVRKFGRAEPCQRAEMSFTLSMLFQACMISRYPGVLLLLFFFLFFLQFAHRHF